MALLRTGEEHWFESARRELRVTGHVAYDDGLVRYRVEGDPDIHGIDRLARRERTLNRLAAGDVAPKGDRAVYFGVEFSPRPAQRRTAAGSAGVLGELAEWNGAIEEIEYLLTDASGKSLLKVTAGGESRWFLVTSAVLEAEAEPQTAPAHAPAPERAQGNLRQYRNAAIGALLSHLYLAGSIYHALVTPGSDNNQFWDDTIQGVIVFEFILVCAGFMSAAMSTGVLNRNTGKVEPPSIWVPLGFLVFGFAYAMALFKPGVIFLVYMFRLGSDIWTGLTVPLERHPEMMKRRSLMAMAYLVTMPVVLIAKGPNNHGFLTVGVLYFLALALIELVMLLRSSSPASSR